MIHSTLLVSLLVTHSLISVDGSTNFTLTNLCDHTVWPAMSSYNGSPSPSVSALKKGEAKTIEVPTPWNGGLWGRTFCLQNSTSGNFSCLTGDCGPGQSDCAGNRAVSPVTLAEFGIDQINGMSFFDISLVDGYNIPLRITPRGGSGQNCTSTGCAMDLNATCPTELLVYSPDNELVACQSACAAFKQPQFCCDGAYATPSDCKPSIYSEHFKTACPSAYSYPFDDKTSTFSCSSADFTITFCPAKITSPATSPPPSSRAHSPHTGSRSTPQVEVPQTPPQPEGRRGNSTITIIAIVAPITVSVSLLSVCCFFMRRRRRKNYDFVQEDDVINEITTLESLQIDLTTIQAATRNFFAENKLGEGGFGEVYKGTLPNGQEIAVKKLSISSRQGTEEFKNEVVLLAKLQHRNLVRLLGFCLEREEKMLIYEFMPNKSLDFFLFDPEMHGKLDWPRRYKIVGGIAKGILYLHEDSRLRIIHRDLKVSNILLDKDMNPKIADFGTARLFGVDQTQENTNRIVGTYGYMSPEYAIEGLFSIKSDVFSFGVLLLEIVSGKRNYRFHGSEEGESLLTFAWKLWSKGQALELVDPAIVKSVVEVEVLKCILIGLFCVQDDPIERPTMSSVVVMLASETIPTLKPKQPLFSIRQFIGRPLPLASSLSDPKICSVNDVTLSNVSPR